MNRIEHYHDWLRDAHAMEKQAESMLESMASRIDNYPARGAHRRRADTRRAVHDRTEDKGLRA